MRIGAPCVCPSPHGPPEERAGMRPATLPFRVCQPRAGNWGGEGRMPPRPLGEPIKRNEDPRLLTGQALFVDDVHLPGMLHVAFLRSPYAHARIRRIAITAALQRGGVGGMYPG